MPDQRCEPARGGLSQPSSSSMRSCSACSNAISPECVWRSRADPAWSSFRRRSIAFQRGSSKGSVMRAAPSPSVGFRPHDNFGRVRNPVELYRQFAGTVVRVHCGSIQWVTRRKANLHHSVLPLVQKAHVWHESVADDAGLLCGEIARVHAVEQWPATCPRRRHRDRWS